jgi:hypothetical protein
VSEASITIRGVPASVSGEQMREAVRLLGFDPTEIVEMSFTHDAVHVEVYSDGRPAGPGCYRWTHNGSEAATHRLTIPIIDKEPTP